MNRAKSNMELISPDDSASRVAAGSISTNSGAEGVHRIP